MDFVRLRSWWFDRQGLAGQWRGMSAETVLDRGGWARSVGGTNPYLTLFSRAGIRRTEAETAASDLSIHELPSARGCTYVVPRSDFDLALRLSRIMGDSQEIKLAVKQFGVTYQELDALADRVLDVLKEGCLEPSEIRDRVGDAVRSLGEEAKKRGISSTLPMVLGRLQSLGQIRRQSTNGRLDSQRFGYVLWEADRYATSTVSPEETLCELAHRYFRWIGPARLADFQWFSGATAKAARAAVAELGLVAVSEANEFLAFPEDREAFLSYQPGAVPRYTLVSNLDAMFLHRRNIADHLEAADRTRPMQGQKQLTELGSVMELTNQAILDRGRIVGLWEFDPAAGEIVWHAFVPADEEMRAAVRETETFIRDELGDARTFSLDSPASRQPKLDALRAAGHAQN